MSLDTFGITTLLNSIAMAWQNGIVRACWQGGLFVGVVWLICRLAPHLRFPILSTNTKVWLWWAACLKLVIGLVWTAPLVLRVLPAPPPAQHASPAFFSPLQKSPVPDSQAAKSETGIPSVNLGSVPVQTPDASSVQVPSAPIPWTIYLLSLWLVITLRQLVRTLSRWSASGRLVRSAHPVQEPTTLAIAQEMAQRMGLKHAPLLVQSEATNGPLVTGLLRPVVVLPLSAQPLTEDELRMALAHEFAHLKRGDLWLSLLPTLAQALFFFFPPVWLAAREFALAREEACDLEVLRVTGMPAREYGLLLLKVASRPSALPATAALGAASHFRTLERRLKMLDQYSSARPNRRARAAVALALGLGAACMLPWKLAAQDAPLTPTSKPTQKADRSVVITADRPAGGKSLQTTKPATAGTVVSTPQSKPMQAASTAVQAATSPAGSATTQAPAPATAAADGGKQTTVAPASTVLSTPTSATTALTPTAGGPTTAVSATTPTQIARSTAASDYDALVTTLLGGQNRPGYVSLQLQKVTFYEALVRILTAAGVDFRIDEDVARIANESQTTISFSNVPVDKALGRLLHSTRTLSRPLTYVKEDGLYVILPAGNEGKRVPTAGAERKIPLLGDIPILGNLFRTPGEAGSKPVHSDKQRPDLSEILRQNVTIKAENADLRGQLKSLFESAGINYAFDSKLGDMGKITISLVDRSFQDTLDTMLRQSKTSATYRIESGILTILPKQTPPGETVKSIRDEVRKRELRTLLGQRTQLQSRLSALERLYSNAHPKIQQCKSEIASVEGQIQELETSLQRP